MCKERTLFKDWSSALNAFGVCASTQLSLSPQSLLWSPCLSQTSDLSTSLQEWVTVFSVLDPDLNIRAGGRISMWHSAPTDSKILGWCLRKCDKHLWKLEPYSENFSSSHDSMLIYDCALGFSVAASHNVCVCPTRHRQRSQGECSELVLYMHTLCRLHRAPAKHKGPVSQANPCTFRLSNLSVVNSTIWLLALSLFTFSTHNTQVEQADLSCAAGPPVRHKCPLLVARSSSSAPQRIRKASQESFLDHILF